MNGPKGDTPLIKAAKDDNVEVVRLLIDGGADPNKPNEVGEAPVDDDQYLDEMTQAFIECGVEAAKVMVAKWL